jgi:hypothetical protein
VDALASVVSKGSEQAWSKGRTENLAHVLELADGATCGYQVTRESWNVKTGRKYDPTCAIHISVAKIRRQARYADSDSALRKTENETTWDAAIGAANKSKAAGGDVLLTNVSFGQYAKRVQGAEYDGAMVRVTLDKGAEAFVAAVNAAVKGGAFKVGKAPQAFVAP